jgi:hypothetical protein
MRTLAVVAFLALSAACQKSLPPPQDLDLSGLRAGFHCDAPRDPGEVDACRAVGELESGSAIADWPQGNDIQLWIGVDHCVSPTTTRDYDAYQLVYLRAGKGTPYVGPLAGATELDASAAFASPQIKRGADPSVEQALRALALGEKPAPSVMDHVWMMLERRPPDSGFRTLVRTPSGKTVGDGGPLDGIWFLRAAGSNLVLVGPRLQSGCVSELHRVP